MRSWADRQLIEYALSLICNPGDVYELRVPNTRRGTVSGYFDDFGKLAAAAANLSGQVESVYLCLNPVMPDLLGRANNRTKDWVKHTTSDAEVIARRWLLVDFDVKRPAGISTTDAEHDTALARAASCLEFLKVERGVTDYIFADSGNGGHLLIAVNEPNTEATKTTYQLVLTALAQRFNDALVEVDPTTYNAARICTLYGTMKCKGDSIPTRPHRLSGIIEVGGLGGGG